MSSRSRVGTFVAVPLAGIELPPEAAVESLESECFPLLAVLGRLAGRAVRLDCSGGQFYVDRSARGEHKVPLKVTSPVRFDIEGPDDKLDFSWRVDQAMADPVYRDLLALLTEAEVTENPRPVGYKMLDRLGTALGNRGHGQARKVDDALTHLGLSRTDVDPFLGDQSLYEGDRHALGRDPKPKPRVPTKVRDDAVLAAQQLVKAYERQIAHRLGATAPSTSI